MSKPYAITSADIDYSNQIDGAGPPIPTVYTFLKHLFSQFACCLQRLEQRQTLLTPTTTHWILP